jgi:hypothetical protein
MRHGLGWLAGAFALWAVPLYAQTAPPKLLPDTRPGVLSTIAGKAVSATNAPVGGATLRLRDVRFGRVVSATVTDRAGQFDFKGVDTGSYLVEMTSQSGNVVLASSSILYVGSGETITIVLTMPPNHPALGSLLINSAAPALLGVTAAAEAITAAAGASNTPAATPVGEPATSQNPSVLRHLR